MTASTCKDQAYAAFKLGDYEQALHHWKTALVQAGEDPVHRAALYTNIGIACLRLGRADEASHSFEQAIAQYQPDEYHCSLGKAYMGLGRCYHELGRFDQAISTSEQAAMIFDILGDDELAGKVRDNIALYHNLLGEQNQTTIENR